MDAMEQVALAAGLAWASGIRLYAVVLLAGLLGRFDYLQLPPHLTVLENPLVIAVAGVLFVAEFVADKVPAFDSIWDSVHTFIRVPAGAVLAAAALGSMDPLWVTIAAILGGGIASTAHLAKAGSRALINTSPEPVSNWGASLAEDLLVPAGLWLAIRYPLLFLVLLAGFIGLALWLMPRLWRVLRSILGRLRRAA